MKEQPSRLSSLKAFSVFCFFLLAHVAYSQSKILISDTENIPLIGVQVFLNEKAIDASDINGNVFFKQEPKSKDILRFTYLSYQTLEKPFAEIKAVGGKIIMNRSDTELDEVLIVGRNEKVKSGVLLQAEIITKKDIEELEAQTPADLLEKNGSVFIQKSQMGGGSPVIRGFEANKILLVIDGVRMNNAIYRSGHLQNAITVDEMVLEQAEVLFGPGSIIYGSDALGGVLHFRTKTGKLSEKLKLSPSVYTRVSSASKERTLHANLEFGSKNYSGIIAYTNSAFGDLRTGNNRDSRYPDFGKRPDYAVIENGVDVLMINEDENVQIGTGYNQQDFFTKLRYVPAENLDFNLNLQYSTSSDVPRYDQLSERSDTGLAFAEWYYGPQNRFLASLNTKLKGSGTLFDELYIINSYQRIDEDRISRIFGEQQQEENNEDLHVFASSIDVLKNVNNKIDFRTGAEIQYNGLSSTANQSVFTRYPSGENSMLLAGVYAKSGFQISDKTEWQLGLRYSYSKTKLLYERDSFFEWPEYFYNGIENNNTNLSFLSSLSHNFGKVNMYANGGTSFRAPNIDDLAKTRVKADEISVPNPELKPEKTWNAELGAAYKIPKWTLRVNTFYTFLRDAIVRQNFMLIDGSTSYNYNGNTLNVVANINASKAKVYGVSFFSNVILNKSLEFTVDGSLIKGRSFDEADVSAPLGHIPPFYGKAELTYQIDNLNTRAIFRFNGAKDIEDFGGSVDNPEFATATGSLAWTTWNLYNSYKISDRYTLAFSVENILDLHYRTFSSGVSASGRNFILSFKGTL